VKKDSTSSKTLNQRRLDLTLNDGKSIIDSNETSLKRQMVFPDPDFTSIIMN
jgi:hypothetical protein